MSLWLPCRSPTVIARLASPRYAVLRQARVLPVLSYRTLPYGPLITRYYSSPPPQDHSRSASSTVKTDQPTAEPKTPPTPPGKEVAIPQPALPARVWSKVKHEAQHYWHGSKLLVSEVRISARLQWKLLHGDALTRRERRQVSCNSKHCVSSNAYLLYSHLAEAHYTRPP